MVIFNSYVELPEGKFKVDFPATRLITKGWKTQDFRCGKSTPSPPSRPLDVPATKMTKHGVMTAGDWTIGKWWFRQQKWWLNGIYSWAIAKLVSITPISWPDSCWEYIQLQKMGLYKPTFLSGVQHLMVIKHVLFIDFPMKTSTECSGKFSTRNSDVPLWNYQMVAYPSKQREIHETIGLKVGNTKMPTAALLENCANSRVVHHVWWPHVTNHGVTPFPRVYQTPKRNHGQK